MSRVVRRRPAEPVPKRCVRMIKNGKVLTPGGIWRKIEQEPNNQTEGTTMAKSVYNLASMHKIDPLREDVERLVAAAVADCKERPGLMKAREVKITIKVTPHPQDADDVFVDHDVQGKLPNRVIDKYRMQATANNGLKFQPNSPVDPDQESFDFGDED